MVWLVEKKVFYHHLDLGYERLKIPIRVMFEFEVKEGALVQDSLSFQKLYNRKPIEKRYPNLKAAALDEAIDRTIKYEIRRYMKECGYISNSEDQRQDV